ncbi:transcription factor bHLH140-like isoform X3 [Hevea brasiliensis]|uniref:transcription factor bHLH140-like isoform X3 n=1 Tax=Hevea brasiliensis TaxID=3981 RepID=UPI0025DD054A|nr:transcription factor bHLH140-like isoform X3 [Hevea brasiliensis]XP_057998026.1 transcription factor bHLH140-like isoform X3 [Hevea brasiliensis]
MDMDCDDTSKPEEKSGEEERKPIVVILVGAPGSGKSTFCEHVMCSSSRPWVRICQDTINNGKAGTKPQCLKAAASALKEGKSVFIDRCNLDREQRVEFVKLGGSQIDVHAVVLDLPAQLCISRSVKRTGHEGNLQGGKAAAVVNRMLQKKELPKLSEGLSRIMFCQSESDVQAAINSYCALGPLDTLPNGSFGQKNPDAKVQLGIMKFLKKVDVPSNAGSSSGSVQDSAFPQVSKERNNSFKGPDNLSSLSATPCKDVKESEDLPKHSIGCDVTPGSIPTLAFPSISTADFQFNSEKASDIMVEKVEEFVKKLGNARLVLVDLSHGSKILSLVRVKAAQRNIDSKKFFTFVGDITQLYSQGGLRCNVIANAANWRLKPGGGGVNAAIFSAAGPALEVATKERAASLLPGHAVVVPLPSNSPLYIRERVSHIIHVLGPNMNPQRPNCLKDDYIKGCKILRDAYTSLFDGFLSVLRNQAKLTSKSLVSEKSLKDTSCGDLRNYLANGDQKTKRDGNSVSERSKKCKGSHYEIGTDGTGSGSTQGKISNDNSKIDGSTSKSWASWAQALCHIAMRPEKHKNVLLEISDDVAVLNDLYPKAQKHVLILARCEGLDCLADVQQEHLQLLTTMHDVGLRWAEKFLHEDSSMIFRLGYHSVQYLVPDWELVLEVIFSAWRWHYLS